MEASQDISQQPESLGPSQTLRVDFSWKKFKSVITSKGDPGSEPIYIIEYQTLAPHLVFKTASNNETFGTGTLHPVSINADCDIRGQHITLEATKRFKTAYMHLSHALSTTDEPVPMTWTSASDFKTWDFICLDEHQLPIAKFSAELWTLHKVGQMEFLGPKTASAAVREEIIVVGLTLLYCMALRTSSPLSLLGAIFAHPAQVAKVDGHELENRKDL